MSGRVRLKDNPAVVEDAPSLMELCFHYLVEKLPIICTGSEEQDTLELRDGIVLPYNICNRFFTYYHNTNSDVYSIINLFKDTSRTWLKHVAIRNSLITDERLQTLLRHNLISLSLWYCDNVSRQSYDTLLRHGCELRSLELGRNVDLLKHGEPNEKSPFSFQLDFPRLQRLTMMSVVLEPTLRFEHLGELSYLNLTCCIMAEFSLEALVCLPRLHTLILYNVWPLEKEWSALCSMKQLEYLDISVANSSGYGNYKDPDYLLATLVESLPLLTHLDISGTNLAGRGVAKKQSNGNGKNSDIPGLVSRVDRPLEFLGLYNTAHSACRRHDIPAIMIAGEANEEQILTSAVVYQDRPNFLTKVLNDLYYILRSETCQSIHRALDVVLMAMDRHLPIKHTQISGSATLFYIVKGRNTTNFGPSLKKHIIRTLLNGMSAHLSDDTMMRNGCLTLCQFSIPNDVLFEYERVVTILLECVLDSDDENFVQRIAVFLLNSMASRVDKCQKLFLGDIGTIARMISLIQSRIERNTFDDVMEVAWATMWNVTDETPINCERFLDLDGMKHFLSCLRKFPEKPELLRNMLGLLGNVAEVPELRSRLMTAEFITVFAELLNSTSDGIEVSYNAAGVLAHIASDGPDIWTIQSPAREDVLDSLVKNIERWDLGIDRNINYRSMEPIFRLVRCYNQPQCQHWAVWALANLTKVYPNKYCHLVESEKGVELLQELIEHPNPYYRIKELASMVLRNCSQEKDTEMVYEG